MPSQPYDLVKDDQDIRVPLYPEQAFYGNGVSFPARVSLTWNTWIEKLILDTTWVTSISADALSNKTKTALVIGTCVGVHLAGC